MLPSGHSSRILCASFSPTGNLLATGSGDATARLWDLFTETPSHTLSGHKSSVLCVEWEALERKLATGGHEGHVSFDARLGPSACITFLIIDEKVRIWDPKTGKPLGDALRGHSKWIMSLSWEPIHMWAERSVASPVRGSGSRWYQKSLGTTVGVFFEGWYRQSLGDRHAEAGVHFGWAHSECERGAMGRWRAQWQGSAIHRIVRSYGSHLGRERGTVFLPTLRHQTVVLILVL